MAKDYSGWGSDDKGEPMVMSSSGGSSGGGGGSGRITQVVLAIAMVLALALAGYAMVQAQQSAAKITKLEEKHSKEIDGWKAKLAVAQNYIDQDKAYVKSLQDDNDCLVAKGKAGCPKDPPQNLSLSQAYIDRLRAFNNEMRKPRPTKGVTPVPRSNPFPAEQR
jgi:uncharacterized protein HemX